MAIVELLGDKLKGGDGEVSTASLCGEGKYLGLYFSAHWCPPCRGFTPALADFYKKFRSNTENSDKLEIVFISSDRSEDQFDEYFKEMPWHALPYDLRDKKNAISKKFKVQGIPTLVFLDSQTGEVVCKDGRAEVTEDPEGKDFPWRPKPISDILPGKFINKENKEFEYESLDDKVLGIYFSAHWCPPCRSFTPNLVESYEKIKEAGKSFEIVFASRDSDEEKFKEYFNDMPWLALPYQDPRVASLAKIFGIQGIPTLVFLDKDRSIITAEGRGRIMKDPEGKDFPWYPELVEELDNFSASIINEELCMILFADNDAEDGFQKTMDVMKPVAEQISKSEKEKGKEAACKFFVAGDDEMVESLQSFLRIDSEPLPLLILLDIPEQRMWKYDGQEITGEVLQETYKNLTEEDMTWSELRG